MMPTLMRAYGSFLSQPGTQPEPSSPSQDQQPTKRISPFSTAISSLWPRQSTPSAGIDDSSLFRKDSCTMLKSKTKEGRQLKIVGPLQMCVSV